MTLEPKLDKLPTPLPGPYNTVSELPVALILDIGLYFSTLQYHKHQLNGLKEKRSDLVQYIENNDIHGFYNSIRWFAYNRHLKKILKRQNNDDIEEVKKRVAVQENFQLALELAPENFASVSMLYIDVKLNGNNVKAFVDTGAQMTIISQECAKLCKIYDLLDTRFQGIAVGVGTNKILGRIHAAQVQVGKANLLCSFNVLAEWKMDLLIGLDQMLANQVIIDLKDRKFIIKDEHVPFLAEHEIPRQPQHIPQILSPEYKSSNNSATPIHPTDMSTVGNGSGIDSGIGYGDSNGNHNSSNNNNNMTTNTAPSTPVDQNVAANAFLQLMKAMVQMQQNNGTQSPTQQISQDSALQAMQQNSQSTVQQNNQSTTQQNNQSGQTEEQRVQVRVTAEMYLNMNRILDLGLNVTRDQVLLALNATNNNLDEAVAFLLAMLDDE